MCVGGLFLFCVCLCVCVCMYVYKYSWKPEERVGSSGAGVAGACEPCEPPDAGARNQTPVLWKYSELLGHLSSPWVLSSTKIVCKSPVFITNEAALLSLNEESGGFAACPLHALFLRFHCRTREPNVDTTGLFTSGRCDLPGLCSWSNGRLGTMVSWVLFIASSINTHILNFGWSVESPGDL